ncbi:hypothetical protein BPO_1530 [Bergeyella porcorum]|uniref:Uncharacterized protein n=1 Tax=Bergeyella porcorum TaxID=1735111 RepID=A0AAU0F0E2_9FLAO
MGENDIKKDSLYNLPGDNIGKSGVKNPTKKELEG